MENTAFPRILPVGDAAVSVEFGNQIDPEINQRVHALATKLLRETPSGIGEAVPAYCSVLIHYDPASIDIARVLDWVSQKIQASQGETEKTPTVKNIAVKYGGSQGPDLPFVAAQHGLTEAEVIAFHTAPLYRVYMIGFTPGFPYLGVVDEKIATPRRDTPRVHVPAGSVGIAGIQTGIYPIDSPGGWQIIGATEVTLFNPLAQPPCLLSPGEFVRFVAVEKEEPDHDS